MPGRFETDGAGTACVVPGNHFHRAAKRRALSDFAKADHARIAELRDRDEKSIRLLAQGEEREADAMRHAREASPTSASPRATAQTTSQCDGNRRRFRAVHADRRRFA